MEIGTHGYSETQQCWLCFTKMHPESIDEPGYDGLAAFSASERFKVGSVVRNSPEECLWVVFEVQGEYPLQRSTLACA